MITRLRRHLAAAVTAVLTTILPVPAVSFASPEIAKKEGLKCTVCHDKAGSKLLTSKGKYYEYMKTLNGYDDVIRRYKKCTSCHSKEPWSGKLTKKGEDLKAKGETMKHIARPESH